MYTVYSMSNCPDCLNAKKLLQDRGLPFEVLTAGEDFTVADLVAKVGPVRTLPQILVNDRHLGGYKDLVRYLVPV